MKANRGVATLLAVLAGAYAAYAGTMWILWHTTGSCVLVSQVSAPSGPLRTEISTCGNEAKALKTEIWLSDGHDAALIFRAQTPLTPEIFDQGPEARQSAIARDIQVIWRNASHVEVSVSDDARWQQDYDFLSRRYIQPETAIDRRCPLKDPPVLAPAI